MGKTWDYRAGRGVAFKVVVALLVSLAGTVWGADFFVSPTASTNGDGSVSNPWTLETVLYPTAPVHGGDTVWLRGGNYIPAQSNYPAFESYLAGSSNAPIIVRRYPGEHVILQEHPAYVGTDGQTILYVYGSNTWFWGLEVTSSNTTRITSTSGCCPNPAQLPLPSGVQVRGPNVKLINLVIHDTRGGLGLWQEAANCEVSGCLIYNNGWKELNGGGHGHGAYCQNSNGVMRLSNNIIFNQFANGIQGYTVNSQVRNLTVERNAVFGNATIANYPQPDTGEQMVFGGSAQIQGLKILNNCVYQSLTRNGVAIRTDYGQNANGDITLGGNYITAGSAPAGNFLVTATYYSTVTITNNTLYSPNGSLLQLTTQTLTNPVVDSNAYYGPSTPSLATNNWYDVLSFSNWKTATGFDQHSTYQSNTAPPNAVIVNPNAYEPKRAHIIVYNWANSNSVSVDVSSVLSTGDMFQVRNGQNFYAPPILTGSYTGAPIVLPLTNLTVAIPNGWTNTAAVPTTGSQFNVFVLTGNTDTTQPLLTGQPVNLTVLPGQPATFAVSATGAPPLGFQWQRNATNIIGAVSNSYTIASATLSDSGAQFRCLVTNTFGSVTSVVAILTVTNDTAPVATMTLPANNSQYSAGDTIPFAGTGTDVEDGNLPASRFTWAVDFYHSGLVTPLLAATTGITNGTANIPTTGDTSPAVWYRFTLTVRDSVGLTNTVTRDVLPHTATMTLQTIPPGLQIKLDGQASATSTAVVGVAGMTRTLEAFQQTNGATTYAFDRWSDAGTAAHSIAFPAVDTTYTAYYRISTPLDGYVNYWRFDEGTGTITADSAPAANNGTLQSGVTWTTGKIGSALNFDGSTGYVRVGTDLSQRLGGTATLAAWIKTTAVGGNDPWSSRSIAGIDQYGGANDIFWGWLDTGGHIGIAAGNGSSARSTNIVNNGAWHHVALTRDAGSGLVQVYVDGAFQASATSETGAKTTPFYSLGRLDSGGYFLGQIDDVRIYSNVLSAANIQLLANPPTNAPPVVNAGVNQTITLPACAYLTGLVTDDGLPNPPASVSTTWSKISGASAVKWANPNAATTTASFAGAGTYILQLTASDGQLTGSNAVTVTVNLPAQSLITGAAPNAGGGFAIQFVGSTSGLTYAVEASTNLVSWTAITNVAPTSTGLYDCIDKDAPSLPKRFYRIRTSY